METAFLVGFNIQEKKQICTFQPSAIKCELSKPEEKSFELQTPCEREGTAKSLQLTTSIQGCSYNPCSGSFAISLYFCSQHTREEKALSAFDKGVKNNHIICLRSGSSPVRRERHLIAGTSG